MKVKVITETSVSRTLKGTAIYRNFVVCYNGKEYRTRSEYVQDIEDSRMEIDTTPDIVEYESEEAFIKVGYGKVVNEALRNTPLYTKPQYKVEIVDKPRGWTIMVKDDESPWGILTQKRTKEICTQYSLDKDTICDFVKENIKMMRFDNYGNVSIVI